MWRRRDDLALTLIEALVTSSLLALLLTLFASLYLMSRRADQRGAAQSDQLAAIALGHEVIRKDLKRGLLIDPAGTTSQAQTSITLYRPQMAGGEPIVLADGSIAWDWATIYRYTYGPDGYLELRTPTETRRIANLGAGGSILFSRQGKLVRVRITATVTGIGELPPPARTVEAEHLLERIP